MAGAPSHVGWSSRAGSQITWHWAGGSYEKANPERGGTGRKSPGTGRAGPRRIPNGAGQVTDTNHLALFRALDPFDSCCVPFVLVLVLVLDSPAVGIRGRGPFATLTEDEDDTNPSPFLPIDPSRMPRQRVRSPRCTGFAAWAHGSVDAGSGGVAVVQGGAGHFARPSAAGRRQPPIPALTSMPIRIPSPIKHGCYRYVTA